MVPTGEPFAALPTSSTIWLAPAAALKIEINRDARNRPILRSEIRRKCQAWKSVKIESKKGVEAS
eukprot:1924610-Pleurochrysis_carterae.AAC.4